MAFGRDGSELELQVFDLQNRRMRDALESIISISGDDEVRRIARNALDESVEIGRKLGSRP